MLRTNGAPVRDVRAANPHPAASRGYKPRVLVGIPLGETHQGILQPDPGENGNTVPLARPMVHGLVPERRERKMGKGSIRELGLLQAEHVRLRVREPLGHTVHPDLQRIDVPRCNTHLFFVPLPSPSLAGLR